MSESLIAEQIGNYDLGLRVHFKAAMEEVVQVRQENGIRGLVTEHLVKDIPALTSFPTDVSRHRHFADRAVHRHCGWAHV